jgi:hypothetical protein
MRLEGTRHAPLSPTEIGFRGIRDGALGWSMSIGDGTATPVAGGGLCEPIMKAYRQEALAPEHASRT